MAFFGDLVELSCRMNTDAWARLSDSTRRNSHQLNTAAWARLSDSTLMDWVGKTVAATDVG